MPERIAPIAKITRPRIRGVFPRERLFGLLDETRKYPVTWISAPAGSGKTTLVAGYLEAHKIPCLWYQMDEGDADIATFFSYLGMAALKAAPQKRKPLPFLTPEYLQGIPTFTLRYFENLFSRLKPPSILVLDNYQTVPPGSNFHEVINVGISAIPEGINVFVVSRHDPPSVLARLRANEMMKMLGWVDLRLTLEETMGIVPLKAREIPSDEVVEQLHRTADGWVAGLVLILESMKRGVEPQILQKMAPEEIIDYFGNEFFNKTDKVIQDFLLKTAFLPKFNVKDAEQLTGLSNAGSILSALSRNNYFTERHYSTVPVYQFHPLYREFLITRARETFSKEELSSLQNQAARLLEQEGQIEAAISVFRDLNDWDAMARLLREQAQSLERQGRIRPLEGWLGSLPQDLLEDDPWLLYWMGMCRLYLVPSQHQPYFEKALERFKTQKDAAGIYKSLSIIILSITFLGVDFKPLDHWIPVLEETMRRLKVFPSKDIELQVKSTLFIALMCRGIQHPEMEERAEQVFSLAEGSSDLNENMRAFNSLLNYRLETGDFGKAAMVLKALQKLTQSRDISPVLKIVMKSNEATYYWFTGRHEECLKALNEGLELSRTSGIHGRDTYILASGIGSALGSNDFQTAAKLLEEMASSLTIMKGVGFRNYHMRKSEEARLKGNLDQASVHADLAQKSAIEIGFPFMVGMTCLRKAQVLQSQGKHPEAAEQLTQALTICHQVGAKHLEFSILLGESLLAWDRGEERSGLVSLRKALALGREKGYFSSFIDQASHMARLCIKALEAGIEVAYVQELIRRLRVVPDQPPLHLETWPWPIKIFTLGRFELLKDGQPLLFQRKVQKKPFLLLKAMIALGGRDIGDERISDMLWPETDGDQAHSTFRTTLTRLRQLIGNEKFIEYHDGKTTINPYYCWVDAWAFERMVEQVDMELKKITETANKKREEDQKIMPLLEKSINLYKGHFLADEREESWTTSCRERLRSKYLRLITGLGDYLKHSEQWEKAVEYYQKALEVDYLAEEFYQNLMICYSQLGQQFKAFETYQRCKKTLSIAFGISPSPKTETIFMNLKEITRFKGRISHKPNRNSI